MGLLEHNLIQLVINITLSVITLCRQPKMLKVAKLFIAMFTFLLLGMAHGQDGKKPRFFPQWFLLRVIQEEWGHVFIVTWHI